MGEMLRPQTESKNVGQWLLDNIVTLIFVAFTLFGFFVSENVSLPFFLSSFRS